MVKKLLSGEGLTTVMMVVTVISILFSVYLLVQRSRNNALIGRLTFANVPEKSKAVVVKRFVEEGVKSATEFQGSRKDVLDRLAKARSQVGGYLIAYQTEDSGDAKKGTLIMHGVPTKTFCDTEHPMCNATGPSMVGKDLYDFETVGGVKEVQLWIDIARKGGGWAAAYWKDKEGQIKPKYYYIEGVPSKGFLLASGYFLN